MSPHLQVSFDSLRFLDFMSRQVMKAWIARESPGEVPWTPMAKPLARARVAIVTTAAVALDTDVPFDQDGERRNPWWGDPSHRVIPRDATTERTRLHHLHIDRTFGEADLDVVLPVNRLRELVEAGEVGDSAPSHYSTMGYLLRPETFLRDTIPQIAGQMKEEAVDAALLVPV